MLNNRRLLLIASLPLAIGLAIGVTMLVPRTPRVTYANYGVIKPGMDREQVKAFLGEPNPDITSKNRMAWRSDEGDWVEVHLDGDDCVRFTSWNGETDMRTDFVRLCDRLPLIGRKPPPLR